MLRVGGRLGWRGMAAGSALALTLAVAGATAVPPAATRRTAST